MLVEELSQSRGSQAVDGFAGDEMDLLFSCLTDDIWANFPSL